MSSILQKLIADVKQLENAKEVFEFVGCQYWACDGPTKRPEDMKTCMVCRWLYNYNQSKKRKTKCEV
jgi:hypothetical protein